jgi:ribosomal RNA-processing protein 36
LKSRLDTLKNRELQQKVLDDYKKKMNSSSTGGKYYLKKSEQRKIIQKHKYDSMKSSQREKVIERKRKRRLGKEFKQLEFNRPRD